MGSRNIENLNIVFLTKLSSADKILDADVVVCCSCTLAGKELLALMD